MHLPCPMDAMAGSCGSGLKKLDGLMLKSVLDFILPADIKCRATLQALLFYEGAWWASLAARGLQADRSAGLHSCRVEELCSVPAFMHGCLAVEALRFLLGTSGYVTSGAHVLPDKVTASLLMQELLRAWHANTQRTHKCPCQMLVGSPLHRTEVLTTSFLCTFKFASHELRHFVNTCTVDSSPIVASSTVKVPGCAWLSLRLLLTMDEDPAGFTDDGCSTQKMGLGGEKDLAVPRWVGLETQPIVRSHAFVHNQKRSRMRPSLATDCLLLRSGERGSSRFSGWVDESSFRYWRRPLHTICFGSAPAWSAFEPSCAETQSLQICCAVQVWSIHDGGHCTWPLH